MKNGIKIFIIIASAFLGVWPITGYAAEEQAAQENIVPIAEGMEGKISLDLRNIDIMEALKFLTMKAKINIITTQAVSKNATGRVNLVVENAPVKDVFDIMLRSNNLAYTKQGDVYNVMTQDEYKALYGKNFSDVRQVGVFHIKYAIPEHVFNLVDTLKSDIGRVLVDTESGTVMLLDSPEKIETVGKALRDFEEQSVVRTFKLNYARAGDVEQVLKTQLDSKKVGMIKADDRSNQVVVQTLPDRMKQIEELIAQLDQKTKEVIIETYIVQVKLNDNLSKSFEYEGLFDLGKQFGLTYLGSYPFSAIQSATDAWASRKDTLAKVGYVGSYPFSGTTVNKSASKSSLITNHMHLGVIGRQDFDTVMTYLQVLGETRILSSPKLAVVNNQEAKIHVGQKEVYVTTTTTTGQATSTVSEQINFVDTGVLFSVVPNINYDDFVTLKVKAEVNSVIDTLITPTKNEIPILDTSLAETTVMVKEGSTIIIGGLRKDEKNKDVTRTPFFGSIPILGQLFTQSSNSKERSELLIILTPRLISGETLVTSARPGTPGLESMKDVRKYPGKDVDTNLPSEVYVTLDSTGLPIKGPK